MQVHPEFDPTTRTWFVSGRKPEAPTIDALLGMIAKSCRIARELVAAKDYYANGERCPSVDYGPASPRDICRPSVIGQKFYKKAPTIIPVIATPSVIGSEPRKENIPELENESKVRSVPKRVLTAGRSTSNMSKKMRADLDNQALDMWAAGLPAHEIAAKLDLKINYIAAALMPRARRKGDPRAVVRNPETYGTLRS